MSAAQVEFFGGAVSFFLSILVFSYLLGDNPVYRVALHLFVGVAAGYAAVIIIESVVLPLFRGVLDAPGLNATLLAAVPLILGGVIWLKTNASLAPAANLVLAFMVGVGAAVAVGGAVSGTLFPQIDASALHLFVAPVGSGQSQGAWFRDVVIILVGTTCSLLYFLYWARRLPTGRIGRPLLLDIPARAGTVFVMVALAALYAGALSAAFAILQERVLFIRDFVIVDLPGFVQSFTQGG